jgi:hypothetical protein
MHARRYNYDLLTIFFIAMLASQVLNNEQASFFEFFSVGKIFTATFIFLGSIYILSRGMVVSFNSYSFQVFLILVLYFLLSLLPLFYSIESYYAIKYFITVTMQFMLSIMVILCWKKSWIKISLNTFILVALILVITNSANAFLPGFELMRARDLIGREFFGIKVSETRVITFTNIYGQFACFVLVGGWILIDNCTKMRRSKIERYITTVLASSILLFGVISTQSRSTYIGFFIATVVFVIFSSKTFVKSVMFLILFWFIIAYGGYIYQAFVAVKVITVENRIKHMHEALFLLLKYPMGLGQGGFQALTGSEVVLHNTFLEAFVIGGAGYGLIFLLSQLYVIFSLWPYRHLPSLPIRGFIAGYFGVLFVMNFYNGITEYQYFLFPVIASQMAYYAKYCFVYRGKINGCFDNLRSGNTQST